MARLADLHIHTNFSDGTFTPLEIVQRAIEKGLCSIAITDHDCIDGIEPALKAAKGSGLEVVPGIEITAETDGCEVHMLGFFIDYKQQWFKEELLRLRQMRDERMSRMLKRLSQRRIDITLQDVKNTGGKGSLGRLHLAAALFKKGYVPSIQAAFDKFLGNGKPCYVIGGRITTEKAISIIAQAGGVPVLAHPYTMDRDDLVPVFVKSGLKGIEAYHTDHPDAARSRYEELAKRYGLLVTGGSDCHGMGKGRVLLGNVTVPYELVEKLKNAASG